MYIYIQAAAEQLRNTFGVSGLDVLCNNAG